MNFLGHLYFSRNDKELMLANLFGDFVRGSKLNHFPMIIQKGIKLHREIDFFIDTHPIIRELKLEIMGELPKVGPIAIDLFFDHLLARNWNDYHHEEYQLFLQSFYQYESHLTGHYSPIFLDFMNKLRVHKWMDHYPTTFGLIRSCEGVSKRISFETKLSDAHLVFAQKEGKISAVFHQFMEDARRIF